MKKNIAKNFFTKKSIVLIIAVIILVLILFEGRTTRFNVIENRSAPASAPKQGFNKEQYSVDEASSLWVIVNKGRILDRNYVPGGLVVPDVKNHYGNAANDSKLRQDAASAL